MGNRKEATQGHTGEHRCRRGTKVCLTGGKTQACCEQQSLFVHQQLAGALPAAAFTAPLRPASQANKLQLSTMAVEGALVLWEASIKNRSHFLSSTTGGGLSLQPCCSWVTFKHSPVDTAWHPSCLCILSCNSNTETQRFSSVLQKLAHGRNKTEFSFSVLLCFRDVRGESTACCAERLQKANVGNHFKSNNHIVPTSVSSGNCFQRSLTGDAGCVGGILSAIKCNKTEKTESDKQYIVYHFWKVDSVKQRKSATISLLLGILNTHVEKADCFSKYVKTVHGNEQSFILLELNRY